MGRGKKSLLDDPGSEVQLGKGKEKEKVRSVVEGMSAKQNKQNTEVYRSIVPYTCWLVFFISYWGIHNVYLLVGIFHFILYWGISGTPAPTPVAPRWRTSSSNRRKEFSRHEEKNPGDRGLHTTPMYGIA